MPLQGVRDGRPSHRVPTPPPTVLQGAPAVITVGKHELAAHRLSGRTPGRGRVRQRPVPGSSPPGRGSVRRVAPGRGSVRRVERVLHGGRDTAPVGHGETLGAGPGADRGSLPTTNPVRAAVRR